MLKIRLMRIGTKQKPFYRIVVVDERAKRTGAYIELLGTYNPLTDPKEIKLKQDRVEHWTKQGAQMTNGFLRMIGKAPQRPPRKPKKEKKAAANAAPEIKPAEKPTEQPKETPVPQTEASPAPAEEPIKPAEEPIKPTEQTESKETETPKPA